MAEPIDLLENCIPGERLAPKYGLRRDILRIFAQWSKEPLTASRIHQILIDNNHDIKMDTLYDNLETLIKKSILYKKQLPLKGKRERPSYEYRLRIEAIYELFKLTEDLVDAMGFAQLIQTNDPTKPAISKLVISHGNEFGSLRSPPKYGELTQVVRLANEDDLEKTWRLAHHIAELQNYCSTESPAYKEYELKKWWELERVRGGLIGNIGWEEFLDGFRKAKETESGVIRTESGMVFGVSKPGRPTLTIEGDGPLCFETDIKK